MILGPVLIHETYIIEEMRNLVVIVLFFDF